MNIFSYTDYKAVILHFLRANKDIRGYQSRLAEIARCQRSHFSLVLHHHHHLSPEQLFRLGEFWNLLELEIDYLLCLLDYCKTDSKEFSDRCQKRLDKIRQQSKNLSQRIPAQLTDESTSLRYYGSWAFQAVHALVTIPKHRNGEGIAASLNLSQSEVHRILSELVEMGFLARAGKNFVTKEKSLHLRRESPLNWINHYHWRNRAMNSCQQDPLDGVHYSAVYALSNSDKERLQNTILDVIQSTRQVALESKEEIAAVFTCDFFAL